MSRYQLVIFDCDGVLVDSERITNQVFADMLGELGLAFTLDDMAEHFIGHSLAHCMEKIAALLGRPPPDDFAVRYRARSQRELAERVTLVPGVDEVLAQLAIPCCVASNGPVEKMAVTLGRTGLLPRFAGRMFSGYEVARPKPAPDLFLHAASRCGAAPADCVVVEDTPTGVTAARDAGMTVLGFAGLMPRHRLVAAGAHRLFDRMAELPALLAEG